MKGAIIISAGFKETGPQGVELERQILGYARRGGMRIIGPNCLGVMNPLGGLNATFAASMARPGKVGFISQSGALCTAVLDWSMTANVGFSAFVSIGSMLDVGWGDLIYYLGDRMYASAKNAAILYCMGITQHSSGTNGVKALSNLALLCGQLGKPGSGVKPLRGQNNVQGACDMGCLPNVYPGYQGVALRELRDKFESHWGTSLSDKPGLTVVEMSQAALDGKIKAIYIMGENPIVTDTDVAHLKKAYSKLDLLVVQDIFLTETGKMADVVFPSLSFLEKDGTFANTERKVQSVRKALNGPKGARADWDILCDLSSRFGYPMYYKNSEEIFAEIRRVTPQYAGITYSRLESEGIQWPCPDEAHPGTSVLHRGRIVRGKAALCSG